MTGTLEVAGIVSADEVAATAEGIAATQLGDGMIPWFAGGHADPWNHVEAAMALDVGGWRSAAERAYQWLVDAQRPDGAWHQYYVEGGVEEETLDANVCAYVATGTWHHFLATSDTGFLETMWPVVERAVGFVLRLQRPRGEIVWARHADGTPWSYALLTASSSTFHSLRCAIAAAWRLGHERPDWELAAASLGAVIARHPEAFLPKDRWAMDWYYPALARVVVGEEAQARLDAGWERFVLVGRGVRCVSDKPWVTAAETCECAIAFAGAGRRAEAVELFRWVQHLRHDDGTYFTGMVHPERVHFPGAERTTYSAAAVVLAADALSGTGRAARLFLGGDVPEIPTFGGDLPEVATLAGDLAEVPTLAGDIPEVPTLAADARGVSDGVRPSGAQSPNG